MSRRYPDFPEKILTVHWSVVRGCCDNEIEISLLIVAFLLNFLPDTIYNLEDKCI